jgi:solute carrier family 25 protein 14/30
MILLASFLSGFAVTCTTSPATNARTMIMASPPGMYSGISSRLIASDCPDCLSSGTYSGMFDCLSAIVRKQGPLGLFQGFSAQWLRFGPYAVVQFVVWEALRDMFGMQPL